MRSRGLGVDRRTHSNHEEHEGHEVKPYKAFFVAFVTFVVETYCSRANCAISFPLALSAGTNRCTRCPAKTSPV